MAGKTHKRRPCLVSREEYYLRYDLAMGRITPAEFEKKIKEIKK